MSALSEAFAAGSILLGAEATDWRAAIRKAGEGLVASGRATPAYVETMVTAVETHGPYIVIAPGVALAHAAITEEVLSPGFSLARLVHPVNFGENSVALVFALAASATASHAALMAEFSQWLTQPEQINFLLNAEGEAAIRASLVASGAKIAE